MTYSSATAKAHCDSTAQVALFAVDDTLEFLLGRWKVTRSVKDLRFGAHAEFVGEANYARSRCPPEGRLINRAEFREVGSMRIGSFAGPASRSLLYVGSGAAGEGGPSVMVHFADGRPFVDLDLSTGAWRADHRCGNDLYEIATYALSGGLVEERWTARGPEKHFEALTVAERMATSGAYPGS